VPDQKFSRLGLGLLNTAQDSTNVKDFEGVVVDSLDLDMIALKELSSANYFSVVEGAAPSFDQTTLGGAEFRINAGALEYKNILGAWIPFSTAFSSASPALATLTLSEDQASAVLDDDMSGKLTIGLDPVKGYPFSSPTDTVTITVTAESLVGDADVSFSYTSKAGKNGSGTATKGTAFDIDDGWLSVTFASGQAYAVSEIGLIATTADALNDGDYSYKAYYQAAASSQFQASNGDQPYLAPSSSSGITISNFNDLGDRISAKSSELTLTSVTDFVANVYRRDEGESDFLEVPLLGAGPDYVDDTRIVELDLINTLPSKDEDETALNAAISNTSGQFSKIFEKNNRLFRVPTSRQDLLLYSRAGAWWGWSRENSFAFDSNIVSIVDVRDPTTVGGSLTTVIFTESSIYHLTGSGSEADAYILNKQVDNITVDPNSVVNMNGLLMFSTRSPNNIYNEGAYGQKVYEYDLQKVIEVSARIQNSPILLNSALVEYAEMIGADKYFMKKVGVDDVLIYHRDAKGWGLSSNASEAASTWVWQSKEFTPETMERFKIGYARKVKLDFSGALSLEFTVKHSQGSPQVYTINYPNASRREELNFLPKIKGTSWSFKLTGVNCTLYNMWVVQ